MDLDLLPESDSSDEDFVPTGVASDLSEEESDNEVPEDAQDNDPTVNGNDKKRKKKSNSVRKKMKVSRRGLKEEEEVSEVKTEPEKDPEEKKKHADSLWADFLKDCGPVVKKKEVTPAQPVVNAQPVSNKAPQDSISSQNVTSSRQDEEKAHTVCTSGSTEDPVTSTTDNSDKLDKVTEVYEFAGEKVVVEKKVEGSRRGGGGGGGVAAILSQMNKKGKLSVLEKSKLDWNSFKEKEGITEQLSSYNRGKNGYLEKQDFLQRTDLRQFELEKKMREFNRSKR